MAAAVSATTAPVTATTAAVKTATTAAVEATSMSKSATVIELRMMAEAVMFFPWVVDDEARVIAPDVSPTIRVWRIAILRVIRVAIGRYASAHGAGDQAKQNERRD